MSDDQKKTVEPSGGDRGKGMGARMRLPATLSILLQTFADNGGSGELDVFYRVTVGMGRRPLPGDPGQWLNLVAHGFIAGEGGKLMLTEAGRAAVGAIVSGQVRTAV